MGFDDKLSELFIDLPEPAPDIGASVSAVLSGKNLYVSGVLPFAEGKLQSPGRVGIDVRFDTAKLAARTAVVMMLAIVKGELGGTLDRVKRFVRLDGFVACGADFKDHLKVMDGAGDLISQIFGSAGKHVRTVAGATSLPGNACVMLSAVIEVK